MRGISSRLHDGSFYAGAMASALALTTFQIVFSLIGYVIYPLVYKLTALDLNEIAIHLASSDGNRLQPDLYRSTVLLGPAFRVVMSGFLTLVILARAYRWTLEAAREGTVECPYCLSAIPIEASRCAYCGAEQPEPEESNAAP